jgi:hypothetical protein
MANWGAVRDFEQDIANHTLQAEENLQELIHELFELGLVDCHLLVSIMESGYHRSEKWAFLHDFAERRYGD